MSGIASLLEVLRCPEQRTPLHLAEEQLLTRLNEAVEAGTLTNRGGDTLSDRLDAALVRDDGTVAYPVIGGIACMLADSAIDLTKVGEI